MILFSCCIFLEKSWVHNTTQQLLVLGTQHQLMKLWMLVVGYTTTNCTKVGCWVHNNQQISDVVLCCVGSCWYNPCLCRNKICHFVYPSRRWQFTTKSTYLFLQSCMRNILQNISMSEQHKEVQTVTQLRARRSATIRVSSHGCGWA